MTIPLRAQGDTIHYRQDAFTVFMHRDLSRAFEMPTETPRDMLMVVEQICAVEQPKRS